MTDPKEQQNSDEEQIVEDLTVPEEQAEAVGGGDGISFNYGSIHVEYTQQKPSGGAPPQQK